eukprot:scaffold30123_cov41-Prasinocladus_malaysianus.AAC.1
MYRCLADHCMSRRCGCGGQALGRHEAHTSTADAPTKAGYGEWRRGGTRGPACCSQAALFLCHRGGPRPHQPTNTGAPECPGAQRFNYERDFCNKLETAMATQPLGRHCSNTSDSSSQYMADRYNCLLSPWLKSVRHSRI